MYVVTVEFGIEAASWGEFMPLMIENAHLSRTTEPGCRQFDICVDKDKPATVFLYEIYDDRAAFDAHLVSPHFKAFAAATQQMILRRSILTWQRIAP